MNNLLNINYKSLYEIYKKMPMILSITLASLVFIWSIVDVAVFSRSYYNYYGIMELPSPILPILIWWIIGAVLTCVIYFFSSLLISAVVVRTDAIVEMSKNISVLKTESCTNNYNAKVSKTEELPEL